MRAFSRRFGIAALVVTLVGTLIGSSHAGVIPWVYNAIFGPVGYGPSPYPYGQMGYGCSPCMARMPVKCRPSPCSPCSSGSCPTYVSYGVRSSCSTGSEVTQWKSEGSETRRAPEPEAVTRRAPEPVDPAPAPKTFVGQEKADAATAQESVNRAESPAGTEGESSTVTSVEPAGASDEESPGVTEAPVVVETPSPGVDAGTASDTATAAESATAGSGTGFTATSEEEKDTTPATPDLSVDPFKTPVPGVQTEEETGIPAPSLPADVEKPAGLDGETSWKLSVPTRRLVRQSSYQNAWLARRSMSVDSEYVIPTDSVARIRSVTRIVSRD